MFTTKWSQLSVAELGTPQPLVESALSISSSPQSRLLSRRLQNTQSSNTSPSEGSSVFSLILPTDVRDVLKDEFPVCDPYQTGATYGSPRNEGGSPVLQELNVPRPHQLAQHRAASKSVTSLTPKFLRNCKNSDSKLFPAKSSFCFDRFQ